MDALKASPKKPVPSADFVVYFRGFILIGYSIKVEKLSVNKK